MKKLYAALLAAALCLSLAACGSKSPANTVVKSAPKAGTDAETESEPLTQSELAQWRKFVSGTERLLEPGGINEETIEASRRIGCFFTSEYDDVRDLDLDAFLTYCAVGQELKTGENNMEFQEFVKAAGYEGYPEWAKLSEAPVPVWRYRVQDINELLTEYAGIKVDDLRTDWRKILVYVPEYDAFYNTTSDFGANAFSPAYGEKDGDSVTLYGEMPDFSEDMPGGEYALTLRKTGNVWHIVSFTQTGLPQRFLFTGAEFVGEWRDVTDENVRMSVTEGEKAGRYNVVITLREGDNVTEEWKMEARPDAEKKVLSYENGVKAEIRSFAQASDDENIVSREDAGYFRFDGGYLTWHDESDSGSDAYRFTLAD